MARIKEILAKLTSILSVPSLAITLVLIVTVVYQFQYYSSIYSFTVAFLFWVVMGYLFYYTAKKYQNKKREEIKTSNIFFLLIMLLLNIFVLGSFIFGLIIGILLFL